MASTLNAALGAVAAMLFWTCLGASITRRLAPRSLVLPMAPVVGWAAHSAAALPIFRVVGFSQPSVLITAALSVIASALVLRARPSPDEAGSGATVPAWAYAAAALLATLPAIALLPKHVADGVILAGPIFDHSKVAIIDEMARLGVPAGNPFFGETGEGAARLDGILGAGDSGGSAWIRADEGDWAIAGVNANSTGETYGSRSYFARVSGVCDWLGATVPGLRFVT